MIAEVLVKDLVEKHSCLIAMHWKPNANKRNKRRKIVVNHELLAKVPKRLFNRLYLIDLSMMGAKTPYRYHSEKSVFSIDKQSSQS